VTAAAQSVWLLPAFAVGGICRKILTEAVAVVQLPLVTVHTKVFDPSPNVLTPVEAFPGELMVPEPVSSAQVPLPAVGTVALSVAEAAQTVWLLPALAVGGR
jgi:hypothetical protein